MAQVHYNYAQATYLSNLFFNAQRVGHLPADNSVPWRYNALLYEQGTCCHTPSTLQLLSDAVVRSAGCL